MKETSNRNRRIGVFLSLHLLLAVYSMCSICSKHAAQHPFLSFGFLFWYGLVILDLGLYAVAWQQIIKRLPLTTAFANKAVTVVWGMIWGVLFFKETIRWNMLVGAALVIFGVILVVRADE